MALISDDEIEKKLAQLPIFAGQVDVQPLSGGITNRNFLVSHASRRYVVRLGEDIPVHHILRSNELAASRAAHAAGLSPAVIHAEPGVLVLDYIESRPLTPEDIRKPENLARIISLIETCHRDIPNYFRGPAMIFWVFHVIRDYAASLEEAGSPYRTLLPSLRQKAAELEAAAGPFEIVFGHNDLLAANILDDGKRLWLIDWDYAGFNCPLFDLGGLASNSDLCESDERQLLETYYQSPLTDGRWRQYQSMKCASLEREAMWSMISELHSKIDFDYAAYTAQNLTRFERAHATFKKM